MRSTALGMRDSMRERIQDEIHALVEHGRDKSNRMNFMQPNSGQLPGVRNEYMSFRTRALNIVGRACGTDSDHYRELRRLADDSRTSASTEFYPACLGIVEAAQHDFGAGLLFVMKSLIAAELLGDFVDQAETLIGAGYYRPAASLAGAVLEDTLRKLCLKRGIAVPERTSIGTLNSDLARDRAYPLLTQKQITAHADIRNSADHGHFDRFTQADVEDMIRWVRMFTEQYMR